jgi:hypothetical protein
MKLGLIFGVLALCATGCAANPALQAQMDSLQKESARQDAQIKELSVAAAKCSGQRVAGDLAQDASDLASAAWSWLTEEAGDARKASAPIIACYRAGSDNVHDLDSAQRLMAHCYNAQH